LATETEPATPTEQVIRCSSATRARMCSAISRGVPSRRVAPETSRNASSSETASTSGVTCRKISITEEETLSKSA